MVAVPSDLVVASPASPSDGALTTAALTRLRRDNVRPLLDSGLARIVVGQWRAAAAAPAAPSAGTGP